METFQTQLNVSPAVYKFTNEHLDSNTLSLSTNTEFRTIEAYQNVDLFSYPISLNFLSNGGIDIALLYVES